VNSSHVRPISRHDDDPIPPIGDDEELSSDDDKQAPELVDDQSELLQAAADLKSIQERTIAKAERLVKRMSERPPAVAGVRR
jgi:hypothetical protein